MTAISVGMFKEIAASYAVRMALEEQNEFVDGSARPNSLTSYLALFFNNYRTVLSKQDIDEIVSYHDQAHLSGNQAAIDVMNYVIEVAAFRMRWQMQPLPFHIISLGENCLPRTVPTKWGLKLPRLLGEPSMPFDLAVHGVNPVIEAVSGRFNGYISSYAMARHANHFPHEPERGIEWNHEVGEEWFENNFEKFKELYRRRIENFNRAVREPGAVLFFFTGNHLYTDTIDRLAASFGSYEIAETAQLFVVSYMHEEKRTLVSKRSGLKTLWLQHPLPYDGYEWFDHAHFSTPQGLAWEREIVQALHALV